MRLFYLSASVQNVLAGSKSDHYLKKFGREKKLGDRSIPNFDHFDHDYKPVSLPALEPQPCMPDDLQNTWLDSHDDDCESYFLDGFCTSEGQYGPYYEWFAAEMVHYGIHPDASFLLEEEGFDQFAQGGYTAANCKACGCVEPTTTTAAPTTTTTANPCVTCSSEPKGNCKAYGDPHFSTFDGKAFNFQGECQYVLARSDGGCDPLTSPSFKVEAKNRRVWYNVRPNVSMVEGVYITFHNKEQTTKYRINLRIKNPNNSGNKVSGRDNKPELASAVNIRRDGRTIQRQLNEMINDDVEFLNDGKSAKIKTWFGLEVTYQASGWKVDVNVPKCYEGELEGLCGNFNGDDTDDFYGPTGILHDDHKDFGNDWETSWIGEGAPESCETGVVDDQEEEVCGANPSDNVEFVLKTCSYLNEKFFHECSAKLDTQRYIDNCVFDYCGAQTPADIDICAVVSAYAHDCMIATHDTMSRNSAVCMWPMLFGCMFDCASTNGVFRHCGQEKSPETRTCGNVLRNDPIVTEGVWKTGCVCPAGKVLQDGICVEEKECGCQTDNGGFVANGYTSDDCYEACSCTDSVWECIQHTGCQPGCGQQCDCVHEDKGITKKDGEYYTEFFMSTCDRLCQCNDGNVKCGAHNKDIWCPANCGLDCGCAADPENDVPALTNNQEHQNCNGEFVCKDGQLEMTKDYWWDGDLVMDQYWGNWFDPELEEAGAFCIPGCGWDCPCFEEGMTQSMQSGESIYTPEEETTCSDGIIVTTPVDCDRGIKSYCEAYGDPHYETFDGTRYNFQGNCQYLLAGSKGGYTNTERVGGAPAFEVNVQNRKVWWKERPNVSMAEAVFIDIPSLTEGKSYRITLRSKNPDMNGSRKAKGSEVSSSVSIIQGGRTTELNTGEMNNDDFTMINFGGRATVETYFGLEVNYQARGWKVDVWVPNCYYDHMEGLCGKNKYDGYEEDLELPGGGEMKGKDFGKQWETPWIGDGAPDQCVETDEGGTFCPDRKAKEACSPLRVDYSNSDFTKSFGLCQNAFGSKNFENCAFDNCNGNRETLHEDACPYIESFASMCIRQHQIKYGNFDYSTGEGTEYGHRGEVCHWARNTGCAPDCGENAHYEECVNSCEGIKTCGNRGQECTDGKTTSMCVCNDGFVLEDGKCIPESQCGCTTPQGASVPNGYTSEDCFEACSCTNGIFECVEHLPDVCRPGCGKECIKVSPLVGQLIRIEARNKNTLEPLGVFLINNLDTVDFQKFKPQQKPAEFKLHSLFRVHQGDDSFGDNAIKLESVSRPGQFLTSSPGLPFHIGLSQEFKTGSEQHFLLEVTKDDDSELQAKVKEIESETYLLWMSQKVDGKTDYVASFKNWDAIAAFGNISRNSVFIIKKDQGVPEIVEQNLGPLEVMHVSFNNLVLQTFGNTSKYSRSLRNPMKKNINRMKRFYKTNQCPNLQHFKMRLNAPDVTPCGQLHALVTDIQGWVTENMNDCANKPNQPADQRMMKMVGRLDRFKKTINSQCEKKYSKNN